jgi:peptidoglycan hydrolase-like protein with peptidoglycan-binding domain
MNKKLLKNILGGAVGVLVLAIAAGIGGTANADSVASSSTPRTLPGDVKPPAAIAPWCVDYSNNLGIGSRGDDVLALQKELTLDGETVPATGYFGPLTAAAVTTLQEKYATDVLTPLGLSRGTGYFGSSTRMMLNSLGTSHCVIPNESNTTSTAPIIVGIAPTSSPIGGSVTILGTGFAATDTVLIDGLVGDSVSASSSDGITINFTVPGTLRPNCTQNMVCAMYILLLAPGSHAVSVMANGLTSNTTTLMVTGTSSAILVQ